MALTLPKTFRGGSYDVTINGDRSINVRPGDWLSKYSMAIYGDFSHIGKFKKKLGGQYREIDNPNLIRAGEILYHPDPLPGEPLMPPPEGVPESEPPIQAENVAAFLKFIKQTFLPSEWCVEGNGGFGMNFSFLTGQYVTIGIRNTEPRLDPAPQIRWYHAVAGGLMIGWPEEITIGGSFSTTQFPSVGAILKSPLYPRLTFDDFRGGILVVEFGATFWFGVLGASLTLILFGMGFPPSRVLKDLDRFFRYGDLRSLWTMMFQSTPSGVVVLAGGVVGIPGIGVAGRVGYMSDFFSGAQQ
jgi:hypothetical protein